MKTNSHTHSEFKIDMHTHMFNARSLPLRGIFKSFGIPDKFNKPLAYICWLLTDFDKFNDIKFSVPKHVLEEDSYKAELHDLWVSRVSSSYIEALSYDTENIIKACMQDRQFDQKYLDDLFRSTATDIEELATHDLAILVLDMTFKALDFKSNRSNFHDILNRVLKGDYPLKDLFENFFKEVFHRVEHALDYLDFIWNISRSEKQIYERLLAFYDAMGVDCKLVHYMMDMSHPYTKEFGDNKYGKTKLPYIAKKGRKSQLSQMKRLAERSSGRLIGFAAFDPWRFYKSRNIVRSVTETLTELTTSYQMKGLKFYPPMGYRANEDENTSIGKVISVFYDYCIEKDIPIFTHCTPGGFEVREHAGELSNPLYWRDMLERRPNRQKLRLCLGHAGGGRFLNENTKSLISAGWVANHDEWNNQYNYARECVKLSRDFENIYCELSNIDSILSNKHDADNLRNNLTRELGGKSGDHAFCRKLIYGTDWHMVGVVRQLVNYYAFMSELFQADGLVAYRDDFFSQNALAYLGFED